mmetsp:Transcript_11105/g.30338  ORF Transcript_11105/g.30338 Transcript_11105/m.30338 type:complete len:411 (-) Transcript_11105:241-1473(-)
MCGAGRDGWERGVGSSNSLRWELSSSREPLSVRPMPMLLRLLRAAAPPASALPAGSPLSPQLPPCAPPRSSSWSCFCCCCRCCRCCSHSQRPALLPTRLTPPPPMQRVKSSEGWLLPPVLRHMSARLLWAPQLPAASPWLVPSSSRAAPPPGTRASSLSGNSMPSGPCSKEPSAVCSRAALSVPSMFGKCQELQEAGGLRGRPCRLGRSVSSCWMAPKLSGGSPARHPALLLTPAAPPAAWRWECPAIGPFGAAPAPPHAPTPPIRATRSWCWCSCSAAMDPRADPTPPCRLCSSPSPDTGWAPAPAVQASVPTCRTARLARPLVLPSRLVCCDGSCCTMCGGTRLKLPRLPGASSPPLPSAPTVLPTKTGAGVVVVVVVVGGPWGAGSAKAAPASASAAAALGQGLGLG